MVRTTPESSRTSGTVGITTAVCIRTGLLANRSIFWATPWYDPPPFPFRPQSIFSSFYFSIYSTFVPAQGGATIVKLQSLLSEGFFGNAYTPDMLLSVTTGKSVSRPGSLNFIHNNMRQSNSLRPFSRHPNRVHLRRAAGPRASRAPILPGVAAGKGSTHTRLPQSVPPARLRPARRQPLSLV